jgi:15-cis-phytoene synthase
MVKEASIDLYTKTNFECSKLITSRYSTSFTLGIRTLAKKYHDPIYAIYGFVRYADEIVDTFHNHNKEELLHRFKSDTYQAIEEGISLNPVLHTFQHVVNQYKIPHHLIDAFLCSMEMDLELTRCDQIDYEKYIYGSAEVVGLMCLKVFCEGDDAYYDKLVGPARSLGAAFQKVNFLRDMKSDFQERGRVYFPGLDLSQFGVDVKMAIENDIQKDFDDAYKGIIQLPYGARFGVYMAYVYYIKLFNKIRKSPVQAVMSSRIRIPDNIKILLLVQSWFKHKLNFI